MPNSKNAVKIFDHITDKVLHKSPSLIADSLSDDFNWDTFDYAHFWFSNNIFSVVSTVHKSSSENDRQNIWKSLHVNAFCNAKFKK